MRRWLIVFVVLIGASGPPSAPERSRLDPELQRLSLESFPAAEPIDIILRLDPDAPPPALGGVAIRSRVGGVVTARTAIGNLVTLAAHPALFAVEHVRTFHYLNDLASASTLGSRGSLAAGGSDTYTFNGSLGQTARIRAHSEGATQTQFTSTDVAGTVTAGGPGGDAETSVTWASTGPKTIVVSFQSGAAAGSYVLFISSTTAAAAADLTGPNPVFYAGTRAREARTIFGVDGTGVVIGIVDSGADITHVDLRNASGTTRMLALWDQTLTPISGETPASPGYGVEYSEAQINSTLNGTTPGLVREQDTDGHGTHVAGTAAGTSPTFRGVAPGARLIIVKTDLNEAHIIDAVNWFFTRAGQLGYGPAVLNLSLGTQTGPHDGTSGLDAACDAVQTRGRYVVAAAGNDGKPTSGRTIHAQTTITASGAANWTFHPTSTASSAAPHVIDIWADAADAYSISFTDTGNPLNTVTATSGTSGSIGPSGTLVGKATINNKTDSPTNGATHIQLQLFQTPANDWTIGFLRTTNGGSGKVDGWIGSSTGFFNGGAITLNADGSVPGSLSEPGTSKRAVTAGAYREKFAFSNATPGVTREADGIGAGVPGALADFSSRGPTRDGRAKPDVLGPGAYLGSAKSANSAIAASQTDADGIHAYLEGTSMSTAEISGIMALMLQRNSIFLPEEMKANLSATLLSDAFASGKINAVGLVGSEPVRVDVSAGGHGCSGSVAASKSSDGRLVFVGWTLALLAWRRTRRFAWLGVFLLLALPAMAQEEEHYLPMAPSWAPEPDPLDEMTVTPFIRAYAGGWGSDGFQFDAIRADGERSINVSVMPLFGLEAGVRLIQKWSIFGSADIAHSGALTIYTAGAGISYTQEIGDFVGKLPPSEITFYAGGLWGHADVNQSDFGTFNNAFGGRAGIALAWRTSESFAVSLFGEFRAIQFKYQPDVIGGDSQLGGAGFVAGLSAELRF